MTGRRCDVVVIGDGPSGSALAAQCARLGVDVLLVGRDEPWAATYGTWVDDLDSVAGDLASGSVVDWFAHVVPTIDAFTDRTHTLHRPYGVIANDVLRSDLRRAVVHVVAGVERVEAGRAWHHVVLDDEGVIHTRMVIDAAGWPSRFASLASRGTDMPAWQTAFGVVLDELPAPARPVLMDFRPAQVAGDAPRASTIGPAGVTTFGYVLPVADGWMVEETVLAARPAVEPVALVARLAARLGRHPDELLAAAGRREYVRIPMGGAPPSPDQPFVAFGAAAGYVHPATGYSVGASLRMAAPVASAVADTVARDRDAGDVLDVSNVWEAVWPTAMRRTRVLHDFGLEMLLRLDSEGACQFFGTFFDLPVHRWSAYLRVDAAPSDVASVMAEVFRSSSWSLRRRLAAGNPAGLARLLRP
jgi:lycopene beta-cyclase